MCRAPEAGYSSVKGFGDSGSPPLSCDTSRIAILMSSGSDTGRWQRSRRVAVAHVTVLQPLLGETALMLAARRRLDRHIVLSKAMQMGNRIRTPECHSSLRFAMGPKLPFDSSCRSAGLHSPTFVHRSVEGDLKRHAVRDPPKLPRTMDLGSTSSNGDGLNHRH